MEALYLKVRNMSKLIAVWQCDICKDVICSNNWSPHNLDMCKCGKSGYDMKADYARVIGSTVKIGVHELKDLLGGQDE